MARTRVDINTVKSVLELSDAGLKRSSIAGYVGCSCTIVNRIIYAANIIKGNDRSEIARRLENAYEVSVLKLVAEYLGYTLPKQATPEPDKKEEKKPLQDNTGTAFMALLKKLDILALKLDYIARLIKGDDQ